LRASPTPGPSDTEQGDHFDTVARYFADEGGSTMSLEQVRGMLLWSAIINYVFLALWGLLYLFARGLMYRISRWWRLTPEQFDAFQFGGILLYKMGIWMFFIIPCIALYIVH
jgi:hypothetical protein